ncbi:MAG: hypothetical protein LBD14_06630 [Puniceicoccales bacterium]|jgi:hypothetical protein|nr:hypothetical protein [Puniceicoccales bacterium]
MKFTGKSIVFCGALICIFHLQACVHLFDFYRYETRIVNLDDREYWATEDSFLNGNVTKKNKSIIAQKGVWRYGFSCCGNVPLGVNGQTIPESYKALIFSPPRDDFFMKGLDFQTRKINAFIYFSDSYPDCAAVTVFIHERKLYLVPNEFVDDAGRRYDASSFIRNEDDELISWVSENKEMLMDSQPAGFPMVIPSDNTLKENFGSPIGGAIDNVPD